MLIVASVIITIIVIAKKRKKGEMVIAHHDDSINPSISNVIPLSLALNDCDITKATHDHVEELECADYEVDQLKIDLGRTTGEKAVELTKNEAYGPTDSSERSRAGEGEQIEIGPIDSSERPRVGEGEQMENGPTDSSERPRAGDGEQVENGHSELKFQ